MMKSGDTAAVYMSECCKACPVIEFAEIPIEVHYLLEMSLSMITIIG